MIVAIALAQLADLVTFFGVAAVLPLTAEANPLMRALGGYLGLTAIAAVKAAGIGVAVAILDRLAHLPRPVRWAVASYVIGMGAGGAATNLASLIIYLRG